jgi:hypothetical protein
MEKGSPGGMEKPKGIPKYNEEYDLHKVIERNP